MHRVDGRAVRSKDEFKDVRYTGIQSRQQVQVMVPKSTVQLRGRITGRGHITADDRFQYPIGKGKIKKQGRIIN